MPSDKNTFDYSTSDGSRNGYKYENIDTLPPYIYKDIVNMIKGGWADKKHGTVCLARICKAKSDVHSKVIYEIYRRVGTLGDYYGFGDPGESWCSLNRLGAVI